MTVRVILLLFTLASVITYSHGFSYVNASGVSTCKLGAPKGDLFGFSLTTHTLEDGSKVLLVGAPKAKIGTNREGTVYSCKLGSNLDCSCTQLNVGEHKGILSISPGDPQEIPGTVFAYSDLAQFEAAKNGSLMGFSVTSNDEAGHAAACAPLHLVDGLPFGSCVGLTQALNQTLFRAYLSFGSKGIFASGSSVKLRKDASNSYRITAGAPLTNRNPNRLSIGSVDQIMYTNTTFNYDSLKNGLEGNSNELRVGSVSSYVGYAIDYGYFSEPSSSATQKDVIASAPRYNNHKGAVFVFSEAASSAGAFGTLTPSVIAQGDSIGSYFGYSILVVNFDSTDECDDLIIGSPLQSTLSPLSPDRGQVTVYRGAVSGGICQLSRVDSYRGEAYDRLGASITNLGDINRDGVPDIAVSGLNTPNIYVYLGTPSGRLIQSQLIDTSLYGFSGIYAMHGGVDFNGDEYPDIAFSDPAMEIVRVIVGSPLVRIAAEFDVFTEDGVFVAANDTFDVTEPKCESSVEGSGIKVICFVVRPCFTLTSVQPGQIPLFSIDYFIDLDLGRNASERVYFIEQGRQSRVQDRIELQVGQHKCSDRNFTAYFVSNFGDISPVEIKLDIHDVPPAVQNRLTNDSIFTTIVPVLDRSPELLYKQSYATRFLLLEHPCSDGVCNVDLALQLVPVPQLFISEDIFKLDILVTNNEQDPALQTYFTALFPDNIEVVQRQLNATNELSGDNCAHTSKHQICSLSPNPFMSTRNSEPLVITYTLKFTFEFSLDLTSIAFIFNISSTKSIDVNATNNQKIPEIKLNATADLFFQVKSSNDRITLRENDDGSYADTNFVVTFRVGNRGPTWVPRETMKIVIFWPLCIRGYCNKNTSSEDSIRLMLNSISYITQSFVCEDSIALEDILTNNTMDDRNFSSYMSYQLCNETAICVPIVCTVQLLRANSNTYITIASTLNLGADVQISNSLLIQPSAFLVTPQQPIVTLTSGTTISQKIYVFPQANLEQCIMIFPIISGVVAGIVFIIVVGLIIWLVNFTRQERYVVVKRRKKLEASRSVTPSITGHGIETSQL